MKVERDLAYPNPDQIWEAWGKALRESIKSKKGELKSKGTRRGPSGLDTAIIASFILYLALMALSVCLVNATVYFSAFPVGAMTVLLSSFRDARTTSRLFDDGTIAAAVAAWMEKAALPSTSLPEVRMALDEAMARESQNRRSFMAFLLTVLVSAGIAISTSFAPEFIGTCNLTPLIVLIIAIHVVLVLFAVEMVVARDSFLPFLGRCPLHTLKLLSSALHSDRIYGAALSPAVGCISRDC